MRQFCWIPMLLAFSLATAGAAEQCHLARYPDIPVTMLNGRPTIPAEINGFKTRLLVDTGAYVDTLSPAEAAEFKLPLTWAPPGYFISGGLGNLQPKVATIKSLVIGPLALHQAVFLVGANDLGEGIAGVLGENLYEVRDVELDFANGVMRFIQPTHCDGHSLAYWAAGTGQTASVIGLQPRNVWRPQLLGTVEVNGQEINAIFDTGATTSFLSLAAAKRAGVSPKSPGVTAVGTSGKLWSAPIAEIQLGDNEKIEHTHILVEDYEFSWGPGVWMFIGADFFLSHHVYLATSQSRLYFTYNGGPVFDLNPAHARPDRSRPAPTVASQAPAPSQANQPKSDATSESAVPPGAPTDAAGLMRQALANANRLQFQQALAELTQACLLSAHDADYRYQRGVVYWRNGQPDLALQDFDAALQLDPDDFEARLWRAEVRLLMSARRRPDPKAGSEPRIELRSIDREAAEQSELRQQSSGPYPEPDSKGTAEAKADLDAVDRLAPAEADLRLTLGRVYEDIGQYAQATRQYDRWITYHPADYRLAIALTWRCGSQAQGNENLQRAQKDCNAAYALMRPHWWSSNPKWSDSWVAPLLRTRSLIGLREGNLDGAIADDDAAIKLRPDDAYALYARGLAELRKGSKAQGQADLAAAERLDGDIARPFVRMGLTP